MCEDPTRPVAGGRWPRFFAAGLLAIVQLLSATSCSDDPLPELLSQAELAMRSDDARAAAVYYGTAAAKAPRDDFIRWQLAKVLLTVRDGAAAEKEIRIASGHGVDDERTRPALAEALFLQGRYQAAADLPIDGLGKKAAAVVLAFQGLSAIELGQIKAAVRLHKQAERLSRHSADVAFLEAELARLREDRALAKEALNNVRLLEPEFPYAPARLGEIALAEGELASAERYFSEALERHYGPWRDQLNRGIARLLQGKADQALQDARELLASSAGQRDVHLFAYQVYATRGEIERARQALEQALQRDPNHYRARVALARIELAAGRRERGEALVQSAHLLSPAFVPASRLLAALLLEQDRAAQALEVMRPAIEASPEDPQLQRMRAHAYLKQGRYDELIGLAEGLRGQIDTAGLAAFDQGISLLRAGEFGEATAALAPITVVGVQDLPVDDPLEIGLAASPESPEAESATAVAPGQGETGDRLALRDLELDTTVAGAAPSEDRLTPAELTDGYGSPRIPDGGLQQAYADAATVGDPSVISAPPPAATTRPVEAPPDEAPTAPNPLVTAPGSSVEAFVHDWAAAWSRQDVDAYLMHYADDFRPPDGASRADWEDQRRARLTRPEEIIIRVSGIEVEQLDERRVRARFEQVYRASHYQDRVTKTLELGLQNEDWKILREFSR